MKRYRVGLSWLLVLTLLFTACAGMSDEQHVEEPAWDAGPMAPEESEPPRAESADYDNAAGEGLTEAELAALAQDRMIIYTGELALVVVDTTEAQDHVERIATEAGGYIASASSYAYDDGLRRVTITFRVPAEAFMATMSALRELALEIERDTISTEDVTQEYVDLESRLSALEAKAARLEELMAEAEDTEAVLAVYKELSETEIRIEETKGRMRFLERQSAMSTITVHLTPDEALQPVEIAGWRPGGTVRRAVEALIAALQFLVKALIWLIIVVVPVVGFLALIIFVIIRLAVGVFGWGKRKVRSENKANAAPRDETNETG